MATIKFKNLYKSKLFLSSNRFVGPFSSISSIFPSNKSHNKSVNTRISSQTNDCQHWYAIRNYCTQNDGNLPRKTRSLPEIMMFPEIVWPSVLKTIKNFILVNFIIRPYMDRDFTLLEFVAGAKHAIQVVSTKLAAGDLKSLDGLIVRDALDEIHKSVSRMSATQRNELVVDKDDIYLSFPYQIGIMFDDETDEHKQKRYVEITMVYHVLKGLREMKENGIVPPLNIGIMPEYRDKISICNYRFIKEFTKGVQSDWTINIVNHFKPMDYVEE